MEVFKHGCSKDDLDSAFAFIESNALAAASSYTHVSFQSSGV